MALRMIVVFAVALARAPFAASSGSDVVQYSGSLCAGSGTVTDTEWSGWAVGAQICINYVHHGEHGAVAHPKSVKIVCSSDGASVDLFWYGWGRDCSGVPDHNKEHNFLWKRLLTGECQHWEDVSYKLTPAMSNDALPQCLKADLDYVITDSGSSCHDTGAAVSRWANPVRSADGSEVCMAEYSGSAGTQGMLMKCVGNAVHLKEYAALDCTGTVLDTSIHTVDKMKAFMDGDCFEDTDDESNTHNYRLSKKFANAHRPVCLAALQEPLARARAVASSSRTGAMGSLVSFIVFLIAFHLSSDQDQVGSHALCAGSTRV